MQAISLPLDFNFSKRNFDTVDFPTPGVPVIAISIISPILQLREQVLLIRIYLLQRRI